MTDDPRYADINNVNFPALSRIEAHKAKTRIFNKFGKKELGSANMLHDVLPPLTRRCWVTRRPTVGHYKGWGRLIHDAAHIIFRRRHPSFRPHDPGHATLEREILIHCQERGWLDRKLAPKPPRKLSTLEKRQKRLREIEAGIKRWSTKIKRANTAMTKLAAERTRINRAILHAALD